MVPVWFVAVESIPLTSNGKVDLHALPDPSVHGVRESGEYVAPRDETERVMCRVWAEVLGIGRVGLDDNFFEIGGHSLLAARLFARLDKEFGRSLPLGVLFAAPTVRVLAESYRVSSAPQGYSTLVALTTSGSLPAIYAVPGVFGNVIGFAELSRELGLAQPFYGLQSLGLDGMATPLDSIDVMARRYASEIQTIQPHGPYILVGACFGATVAYEMARQLLAAGEEVAFLGLLDPARRMTSEASKNPTSTPRLLNRALALGNFVKDRLTLYLEEMRGRGYGDRVTYIARKLGSLGRLLGKDDAFKGVQREINQLDVYRANLLALDRYRRKPLSGRLRAVEIFETIRRGSRREGEPSEWGALWEDKVIHHRVLGIDSGDMLIGANARVLAALVAERLRVAREGSA
jgi:thioesterase domain-containing protein